MTAKKDPKDVADELSQDVTYLSTLLSAMDDKVQFYLSNKHLLGPHRDFLLHHVREMDRLLVMTDQLLEKLDRELDTASDLLYGIDCPS